jgi:hypothetical protein
MFNFFKKAKDDLQEVFKPIEVTELKSAWKTSDGKLFASEDSARYHQQRTLKQAMYKDFLRPYFRGGERIDFLEVIELFERWELYVDMKLRGHNKDDN